jgi:hypothetical protein
MAHSDDPGDPTMQRDSLLFGTNSVIDNLPTKTAEHLPMLVIQHLPCHFDILPLCLAVALQNHLKLSGERYGSVTIERSSKQQSGF